MYGHVLVLAGSLRYSGAAILCVQGCLRCGAGLVTLALPKRICGPVIGIKPPDAMLLALETTGQGEVGFPAFKTLSNFIPGVSVLVIGPGLGLNASTQRLVRKVILETDKPMVIDASALDALTGHTDVLTESRFNTAYKVVTPHPGEMSRLTGIPVRKVQNNRKDIAKDFAKKYNVTVVLKGRKTVVASAGGLLYTNTTGNPGMARGGSGDILSGMIAALLGQGLDSFRAAKYAVYLHGKAGDLAAKEKTQLGMTASDIVEKIPAAIKTCAV